MEVVPAETQKMKGKGAVSNIPPGKEFEVHLERLPKMWMAILTLVFVLMAIAGGLYVLIVSIALTVVYELCVLATATLAAACINWPRLSKVLVVVSIVWILVESLLLVILIVYSIVLNSVLHGIATAYTAVMLFVCLLTLKLSHYYFSIFKNNTTAISVYTVS